MNFISNLHKNVTNKQRIHIFTCLRTEYIPTFTFYGVKIGIYQLIEGLLSLTVK